MEIWDYDRVTGALLGQSVADPDPEQGGRWLIPLSRPRSVDGGLAGHGSWRIELKSNEDIRQRLAPQLAYLAAVIGEWWQRAGLDRETATNLVLETAETTIKQVTDDEELHAETRALVKDILGSQRAN
ncbi:hypothetical protein N2605_26900 [Bradyrhizobium yuanmingense]|uniref:hypothetical protein n=1 Tax=Bradyrhizobium yuanmingense TaxID=108015 RepID=UPI0021A88870|nr:hypothetical protein [Bradyrhizobium sp. CB1024]UWU83153.1 hypothetical protein N2605_26900 [Bradyrhizobium sp. CB1024]